MAQVQLRRSEGGDIPSIQAIVDERGSLALTERFPSLPDDGALASIIVHSYVSMTALDSETGAIVGFIALNEAPTTVPADELEEWLAWLGSTKKSSLTISNTLWLNFIVTKPGLEVTVTEQALRTAHNTLPEMNWTAYCLPKEVSPFTELESTFEEIESPPAPSNGEASEFDEPLALYTQRLFVSSRASFIPTLTVRGAAVEDYDDLIEVFESQSTSLKDQYGEFFLAELIESQNENNQALVAEVDGRAVGLMNLTTEIDLNVLQNCFELGPYNNLVGKVITKPAVPVATEPVATEPVVGAEGEDATTEEDGAEESKEGEEGEGKEGKEGDAAAPAGDTKPSDATEGNTEETTTEATATIEGKEGAEAAPAEEAPAEEAAAEAETQVAAPAEEEAPSAEESPTDETPTDETTPPTDDLVVEDIEQEEAAAPELEPVVEPAEPEEFELRSMAFAVTLFCVDDVFESRAHDFLQRAFDTFPDREYCVITLPHTAAESPLLSRFTSVPPAPSSTFSHVLYVLHRDALLSQDVRVAPLNDGNFEAVTQLLAPLGNGGDVLDAMNLCLDGGRLNQHFGYVPTCNGLVLGVVVLETKSCDKAGVEWMKSAYKLDDYVQSDRHPDGKHARIVHFCLNPIFQRSTRFIFREIMRALNKSMLYYRVYPNQTVAPILSEMVQAPPRRRPMLRPNETRGDAGSGNQITNTKAMHVEDAYEKDDKDGFALHFLSRKLLSEPKMISNARVVVVGASDCGLSALQSLVLLPYLHFTRLTLLAVGGVPTLTNDVKTDALSGTNVNGGPCGYTKRTLDQLNFRTSVNIVDARMVAIDREGKAVMLDDDTVIPYDRLVLATGLTESSRQKVDDMEQHSNGLNGLNGGGEDIAVTALDHPAVHFMEGPVATARLVDSIDTVVAGDPSLKICVYGRSVDAYSIVQGLMARNIAGSRIVRVLPPAAEQPRVEDGGDQGGESELFGNDKFINSTIEKVLQDCGVVRVNGTVTNLSYSDEDGRLLGGTFADNRAASSDDTPVPTSLPNPEDPPVPQGDPQSDPQGSSSVQVAFDVLIFAHEKDVDADIFLAANESGLVYDGRLVVDGRFCTADSSIFAAGTLTKFSRRYGRTRPRHETFNSIELGVALAQALLEDIDPLSVPVARDAETGNPVCPDFFKPKGTTTMLPGGYYFTHVECCPSPGTRDDEPAFVSARELVTNPQDPLSKVSGGRGVGMRYCRLVLDEHRRVASITYLGNDPVEDVNFGAIVGMQESYLNSLEHFFDKGTVTDLIKFLRGDWAVAVYHDRFRELCMNLSVSSGSIEEIQAILTKVRDAAANTATNVSDIATLRNDAIGVGGSKLKYETRRTIELQMLDFLQNNNTLLPMFFLPDSGASKK